MDGNLRLFFYFFFFLTCITTNPPLKLHDEQKELLELHAWQGLRPHMTCSHKYFSTWLCLHISEHPTICLREKLTSSTTVRSIQDFISSCPWWEISNRQISARNNWNSFPMQCSFFHTCLLCSRIFQLWQLTSRSIHQPRLIKHCMEYFSYSQPVTSLLLRSNLLLRKWCYWVWSAPSNSVRYSCFESPEVP